MNITRTKSDWWQWSWRIGGTEPANPLDNWVFEPQVYDFQTPANMRDAMSDALQDIASHGDNLVLFYSGGVDSESILTQALELGIDILPVHMRFVSGSEILNDHEQYHVQQFSRTHNIDIEYVDVDIMSWLYTDRSDLSWYHINHDLGFKHQGPASLMYLRHLVAQRLGRVTVMHGHGDLPIYGWQDPINLGNKVWTINYCWHANFETVRYYYKNYPTDIPYFYIYTPELVYSMMSDFERYDCLRPEVKFSSNSRSYLFSQLFPDQVKRPKYGGWEKFWQKHSDVPWYRTDVSNNPEPYSYIDYNEFYALLRSHAQ
jgi:hypothetical protein